MALTRVVEIPVNQVFQTFCVVCTEVVQVPFLLWKDQQAELRYAISHRRIIVCPKCGSRVELDVPRSA